MCHSRTYRCRSRTYRCRTGAAPRPGAWCASKHCNFATALRCSDPACFCALWLSRSAMPQVKLSRSAMRQVTLSRSAMRQVKLSRSAMRQVKLSRSAMRQGKLSRSAMRQGKLSRSAMRQGKLSRSAMHQGKPAASCGNLAISVQFRSNATWGNRLVNRLEIVLHQDGSLG